MKDHEREELERLLEEWVAERKPLRNLPLPESTPEAEMLRLLRAAEADAGPGLTQPEAARTLRRVLERASAGGDQSPPRPAFPVRRSLALAFGAAVVVLLMLARREPEAAPPPGPIVVKEIRFEMTYEGRVVSLELTAFGPEPLAREASNDTSIPLP